jgi:hypothetical protein
VLSYQPGASKGDDDGWPIMIGDVAVLQFVVPEGTPWQYCVVDVLHVSFDP